MLTIPQAAAALGVSRRRVRQLIAELRLPAQQQAAGQRWWYINPADLERVRIRTVGRPRKRY